MAYMEMDNQFRIKANDACYAYGVGLLYASCFGYSKETQSLIKNINNRAPIYLNHSRIDAPEDSFEIYSSKVRNTDYYHTIIMRKDDVYKDDRDDEYIFCVIYDNKGADSFADKLFAKLNKLSSIPILREWMPFIIRNMREANNVFHDCHIYPGSPRNGIGVSIEALTIRIAWLTDLISHGLKENEISIEDCHENSSVMNSVDGLDAYLEDFNEIFAEKIRQSFIPKFIPQKDSYDQELLDLNDYSSYMVDFEYYPAQLSVVQAVSNTLDVQKSAFICAEMGSGIAF